MSKVELIDWLICDDLRREDNGKLIYIGVYPVNEIVIGNAPMILPKLVVSTKWKTDKNVMKYEFTVSAPDGNVIAGAKGELPQVDQERKLAFVQFVISPFKIEEAGEYKIEGTINEKKQKVGSFHVALNTINK